MSFIGEAVIAKLLDVLLGKLLDSALEFVADHKEIHQKLEEWKSILPGIQAVLKDAEQKQIKNEYVKKWLDDLQDLAYDVDDILDEFAYEAILLQLQKTRAQASTSKVRKLMPTSWCIGSSFTPTTFLFNNTMIPKIKEVTARLNDLTARRTDLGLISEIMSQAGSSKGMKRRLQLTSMLDRDVEYVGRHEEKREMLDLLKTKNSDRVLVLSIVGMGGMGKTTLAQLVYNDATITESFIYKAWVTVSDDFDAVNITNTILKSIDPYSSEENDLNLLQVKLTEKLSGKSLLLVLDDIWNESSHDWDVLRLPFGAGTKIIVTTRHQNVSSIVDPKKAFQLDKLSHADCLSVFTQHALKARNFDGHPELKEVGENIAKRCGGLPLAAKAIGSLLCRVEDLAEWERIYASEIWDLPEDQCGILPPLLLSYQHLPSHLKRCFAYCSILPKDYEFEEEDIILLWRAEGFLQQKAECQITDLGNQYFKDLLSRSFFQTSGGGKTRFVMHDLMNDLAQLIAREACSKLEGDKKSRFSIRTRHSSHAISHFDTVRKFDAFDRAKSLRTFLPLRMQSGYSGGYLTNFVLVDLLPRLGCLRVLSLKGYQITELPDDVFENLKHLRYLNFADTEIKRLPDSLCTLYHLEMLILRGCWRLGELPSKMEDLVNLHYLDIRGADFIERMPSGIGKLKNLETLSDFIIGQGNGDHIRELKYLLNLRGDFCLKGLENVNGVDAGEAKLNEKLSISRLVLGWSEDFEKATRNNEVEERVLDFLRPPKKLEKLVIENYGGAKLSSWIADSSFRNMLSLELRNCRICKSLPSIGRLPSLKDLSIVGLHEVRKIGVELFGENELNSFASLERLCFENLPNWEEWDLCEGDVKASRFPCLHELSIKECPRLSGRLPTHLQSLQKLKIYECKRLVVSISTFPSLRELIVDGCEELVDECSSSSTDDADKVISLQTVSLSNISKVSIPADRIMSRFANSEHFVVDGWKELESLSQIGLGLVGHRFITIYKCSRLVSLETEMDERLQLDKIPGIESLRIDNCERLNRLPKVLNAFTFFTEMTIEYCPGLVSFAEVNFPPALKKLVIQSCENLLYLVHEEEKNKKINTCLLQHLDISGCSSLICLSSRADTCDSIQHLSINSCSKLSNLFSDAKLPVMLKQLEIVDCPILECISQDLLGTTDLECIEVWSCPKIKTFPRGLDKLSHLQKIRIKNCSSLVPFEESGLPTTNLRGLIIADSKSFGVIPKCINNFASLRELKVWRCSADISFPEDGFPTHLTSLEIGNAPKLYTSLVQWGLNKLISLKRLGIDGQGCSNVVSFPEEAIPMTLPRSLTILSIRKFENLERMWSNGFQHLTSLQQLQIWHCPKLSSLPEKDMLVSLGSLCIHNCLLLQEEYTRRKGREWSKIEQIPYVEIQGKQFIPRELD